MCALVQIKHDGGNKNAEKKGESGPPKFLRRLAGQRQAEQDRCNECHGHAGDKDFEDFRRVGAAAAVLEIIIRVDVGNFRHRRIEKAFLALIVVCHERLPPAGDNKQEQERRKKDAQPCVYRLNPLKPISAHEEV